MNREIVVLVVCLTGWSSIGISGAHAAPPRTEPTAEQDCGEPALGHSAELTRPDSSNVTVTDFSTPPAVLVQ